MKDIGGAAGGDDDDDGDDSDGDHDDEDGDDEDVVAADGDEMVRQWYFRCLGESVAAQSSTTPSNPRTTNAQKPSKAILGSPLNRARALALHYPKRGGRGLLRLLVRGG